MLTQEQIDELKRKLQEIGIEVGDRPMTEAENELMHTLFFGGHLLAANHFLKGLTEADIKKEEEDTKKAIAKKLLELTNKFIPQHHIEETGK